MALQARSEATRQKILDAAIDLFSEVGYAAAELGEIIERAGMTKGALYHHFDSKEALATAIIEQGTHLTRDAFRHVCESSSPARPCLDPDEPRLTGDWALLILQVAWLLGSTTSYGYCLLSRLRPAPSRTRVAR